MKGLSSQDYKKMITEFAKPTPSYSDLFYFGILRLPTGQEHKPDHSLANYFLILSELSNLPEEARDLALDAMIHSELEDSQISYNISTSELKNRYQEKIEPLLG